MDAQEPSMQLLAEAAQNQAPLPDIDDQDTHSSSLSDIDVNNESEEAESDDELSSQASEEEIGQDEDHEEDDTEAETERLEESPDKLRKQKKVLLNANNEISRTSVTPLKQSTSHKLAEHHNDDDEKDAALPDIPDITSPISSPADSVDEASPSASTSSSSSRKRERKPDNSPSSQRTGVKVNQVNSKTGDSTRKSINGVQQDADAMDESAAASPSGNLTEDAEEGNEEEADAEVAESNDDVDMDDAAPDIDTNAKSEADLNMRKEAAEKVSTIEEHFAIFRDRMYGEAVASINAELASLDCEQPTHPEYLAISAAITKQSQARIALARSRFSLQVKNWQNRGIAEQAQYHSQYAQSCRDIRDKAVTVASDEWYQIQKVRRTNEDSTGPVSLSLYKRIDLVAQQTAYNTEVSILSGVAQYVGFPAAPEILGASASEIEEDLRSLGTTISPQQSHTSSSISQYLRQNLAAEKQFSRITPWANAQHPSHGLHGNYTWSPARPNSPFTPASQSQQEDALVPVGSASTIVGSHAPTPLSSGIKGSNSKSKAYSGLMAETPSRNSQLDKSASTSQQLNGTTLQQSQLTIDNPMEGRPLGQFSSPLAVTSELNRD